MSTAALQAAAMDLEGSDIGPDFRSGRRSYFLSEVPAADTGRIDVREFLVITGREKCV
jgi:hypothetical protein